jgi:hypothetical protein
MLEDCELAGEAMTSDDAENNVMVLMQLPILYKD